MKTATLDPSHNYLFGFHPHGILVAGAFGNFCTEATGFSQLFPGLTPHLLMLPFWFKVPFFRDYIMSGGELFRGHLGTKGQRGWPGPSRSEPLRSFPSRTGLFGQGQRFLPPWS